MRKILIDECECHPMPTLGLLRMFQLRDPELDFQLPFVGKIDINMARPHKGKLASGFFVKVFGRLWIVVTGMGYASA